MKNVLNAFSVLAVCLLISGVSQVDATQYRCQYKLTEKGQWLDFKPQGKQVGIFDTFTEMGARSDCKAALKEQKPSIEPYEVAVKDITPKRK